MIRVAVLLFAIFASTTACADDALVARAKTVLAERGTKSAARMAILDAYADSLQAVDVTLAARCLEVAGITAFRSNDLDAALARWERGVAWTRAAGEEGAESSLLNALAIGHTARGDTEAALPVYDRALELREALADTMGLGRTWGNLAQAYTNIGRVAEALAATQQEERWLAHVDNPRGRTANALRRAQLLAQLGRLEEALVRSREAVALADSLDDGQAKGLAGMTLGNTLMDLGRFAEALPVLENSAATLRRSGDDYYAVFVEQSIVQCLLQDGRPADTLNRVRRVIPEVANAGHDPLLTVLRRAEGNALFDLGRRREAEEVLQRALAAFEERRGDLSDDRSRAGIFLASGELYASLARCQLTDGRLDQAFATVERGRAAAFRDRSSSGEVGRDRLQAALADESAGLVLFNDPVHDPLTAFVLDGTDLRVVELGAAAPVAEDARTALRLLAAGESLEACRPVLARLDTTLSIPVLAALGEGLERCYVVPPSFLAGFPLGVLHDADGETWDGDRPLSYLPNASSLVSLGGRGAPQEGVLALADPVTGARTPSSLPVSAARARMGVPLPAARLEIKAVARNAADRKVGPEATGAVLREALGSALAVLHLATHAVVDPRDGGRSAVVLAGSDGVEEVTAREIAAAGFRGDLVVLSGCSTFGGQRVLGEGWFGLPRSFLAGGARSVVSTLWDVDDRGARIFVTAFYDALRRGEARDAALSSARRVCRDQGLPPREWAAFVLTGVGSGGVPVLADEGGRRSVKLATAAAGMALLLAGLVWWRRRV